MSRLLKTVGAQSLLLLGAFVGLPPSGAAETLKRDEAVLEVEAPGGAAGEHRRRGSGQQETFHLERHQARQVRTLGTDGAIPRRREGETVFAAARGLACPLAHRPSRWRTTPTRGSVRA